jgi:HEAT repeat protein/beta-lactamase regulating signal transducer with metallopeptidase domain
MLTSLLLLPTSSDPAWLPVADAIVKASAVLAAAAAASFALRRASASLRHLVWTLALVGALAMPVLSMALPRWSVPLVTFRVDAPPTVAPDDSSAAMAPALRVARREGKPAPGVTDNTAASPAAPAPAAAPAAPSRQMSWPSIILAIWAMGAAAILARLVAGLLAVSWMSRRSQRVADAPWLDLARSLAGDLGISRVRFLRSGRASMPMACGLLRPAVVMPADADGWPAARLRIVLLHELAHVKRRDCLTHLLVQVTCALYWFNPLVWVAAKRVRTERERACDDLVLASGTRGPDYADELLDIARVMRAQRFPAVLAGATLAMAHRSQLEGRLMAILDPSVPRAGINRVRTAVAATAAACALMPLASVQPWTYAAERQEGAAAQSPTPTPSPSPTPAPTPEPARETTADSAGRDRGWRRGMDADLDSVSRSVQDAVNRSINTNVNRNINTNVNTNVESAVNSKVESVVNSLVNTLVNTNVNTHVNTNVNAHVNAKAGFDAHAAWGDAAWGDGGAQEGRGRTADPRMIAALTAALKDSDKEVRETAMHALVQLRDPSIFEPLVQALKDAAPDVREQAAFGLGQLRDRRAVDPLIAALKDPNADVREQAAFALGQIRDRAAAAGLAAALKDASDSVREQVVFALGQLRDVAAVPGLAEALRDAKADVREQAAFALGQIRDPKAVEPLISALKDSAPDVRQQAAFALGQIRDRGSVEALVIALKDANTDVREQAAFALGQIRDPRAIDGLTTALTDPSAKVRQQAAFALGQLARSR